MKLLHLAGLNAKEELLRKMARQTEQQFHGVKITVNVKEGYKNMKEVLKDYP